MPVRSLPAPRPAAHRAIDRATGPSTGPSTGAVPGAGGSGAETGRPRLRVLRAPVSEPPAYAVTGDPVAGRSHVTERDRPLWDGPWETGGTAAVHGRWGGASADPLPGFPDVDDPVERRRRRAVEDGAPGSLETYFGPQPTPSRRLPAARQVAEVLCTAVTEVLTGFRAAEQVRSLCSPAVYAWVEANTSPRPRRGGVPRPPRVGRVRVCETGDGIAEVSAVVHAGARSRALVARLVGLDGAWRCTLLQVV